MEPIMNLLKLGMNGASKRQRVLVNNLANASTPNYKRKDLDFISTLESYIKDQEEQLPVKTTSEKHLTASRTVRPFKITSRNNTSIRNDGNNVDIDLEMVELTKNSIYYDTLTDQLSERFKNLADVINKGG